MGGRLDELVNQRQAAVIKPGHLTVCLCGRDCRTGQSIPKRFTIGLVSLLELETPPLLIPLFEFQLIEVGFMWISGLDLFIYAYGDICESLKCKVMGANDTCCF